VRRALLSTCMTLGGLSVMAGPAGSTPSPINQFERDCGFVEAYILSGKRWLKDYLNEQWDSDWFHSRASKVAEAANRVKRGLPDLPEGKFG